MPTFLLRFALQIYKIYKFLQEGTDSTFFMICYLLASFSNSSLSNTVKLDNIIKSWISTRGEHPTVYIWSNQENIWLENTWK